MKRSFLILVMLALASPAAALECEVPGESQLQRHDCYINKYHHQRHVPSKPTSPVVPPIVPANATARCRDGAYSCSEHRSGTCSSHGGVDQWLAKPK
jgi:hypothetical protein